jgi:hypothetical protein
MTTAIGKVLSANDTGETGGHQAGMYVPKSPEILDFFPRLNTSEHTPSHSIRFTWDADNTEYVFNFKYYRSKDEYHLTGMTEFFRITGMTAGETLVLYREEGRYFVSDAPPPGGITPARGNWAVVATR